ncbi:MAG: OmpA family protein [Verrucomicrobia bacterium]|nr:OmpA family protein [Verrucomicrobiota bacterium]
MKPQFGVCKNKVGCSFAYTGEKIPVPADLKCPECGQPLALDGTKQGGTKMVLVLVLLLVLVVAAAGAAFFVFKDQIFHLALNKGDTNQKVPEETKGVIQAQPEESVAAPTPANSPSDASTPDSATANEDKATPGTAGTPPPNPPSENAETEKPNSPPQQTPPPAVSPASASPNPSVTHAESEPPAGAGGEIQPPAALSKTDVDATREDVLKRINAMPRFTAEEKKRLSEKMETARSMERLLVIRFDTGQTTLSRPAADDLVKHLKSKEIEDKISDPTIVFVVAGYADASGDPKKNLQISQQRADNVTKSLKDKTNLLNVIHSIGMGSTDLLDGKRPDQNRAVEIWAVAP